MGLFKKDYIIGLDLGTASLKLARFLKKEDGSLLLESLKSEDVPDGQSRDAALKKLFSGIDVRNSRIIAVINSSGTMVKRAVVPRMPPAELKEAIKLEAGNYFPFDISDSLLDFEELGEVSEKGVKKIEILAGVSPNKVIRECLDSLTRVGIKASAFIPQGLALRNLLALRGFPAGLSIAGLDIGKTFCELVIVRDGKIAFNRRIPVCGDDFTKALTAVLSSASGRLELSYAEAEKIKMAYGIPESSSGELIEKKIAPGQLLSLLRPPAEKLAGEIERSFDFYREESSGMKVNKLVLFGGGSRLKGLDRFLTAELGIEVERLNSWAGLKTKENLSAEVQDAEMFASAAGAALTCPQGLNLLPAEVKDEVKITVRKAGLKAALSAVSTLLILIFIALRINLNVLDKKIATARIELSTLQHQLLEARDLSFISRVVSKEPYWEDVLKEISNVVNNSVYLKEISFHNQQLILRGEVIPEADVQESILEFVRRLESGMFRNVRFSRQDREFQMQMEII